MVYYIFKFSIFVLSWSSKDTTFILVCTIYVAKIYYFQILTKYWLILTNIDYNHGFQMIKFILSSMYSI